MKVSCEGGSLFNPCPNKGKETIRVGRFFGEDYFLCEGHLVRFNKEIKKGIRLPDGRYRSEKK